MRTEEDLRHALRTLEPVDTHTPGLLDRVRAGAAHRRRIRMVSTIAASVVAVAAAAVVPLTLRPASHPDAGANGGPTTGASQTTATPPPVRPTTPTASGQPTSASPDRSLRMPWSFSPVPGYLAVGYRARIGSQIADITMASDQDRTSAMIVVFDTGQFSHGSQVRAAGQPVQVNGRPGFYVNSAAVAYTSRPTLAWEYADNAWALIQGDWPTDAILRTEELKLARAVRFGQPHLVPVGCRLHYLPTALHVLAADSTVDRNGPSLEVSLAEGASTDTAAQLSLSPGRFGAAVPPTTVIGGNPARVDARSVTVEHDGYLLSLSLTAHSGHTTIAMLREIAANLVWAPDVADLSTWFTTDSMVDR